MTPQPKTILNFSGYYWDSRYGVRVHHTTEHSNGVDVIIVEDKGTFTPTVHHLHGQSEIRPRKSFRSASKAALQWIKYNQKRIKGDT